ncbi:MAG: hypothetical protein AAGC73_04770 [Verrucomicrobiota bacterium]
MKSFEEFKESRAGVDPSARRMTEYQWKQAYAAYVSSRERVRGGGGSSSSAGRRGRSAGSQGSSRGTHTPSLKSEAGILRDKVRGETAYSDLRMLVDIFAWVGIALIIAGALVSVIGYPNGMVAVAAIVGAGVQVVVALALRLLAHVFIDVPDIALYRQLMSEQSTAKSTDPDA